MDFSETLNTPGPEIGFFGNLHILITVSGELNLNPQYYYFLA